MEHKNSHNLHDRDTLICIKSRKSVYNCYFVKGRKYSIVMNGLNQTEKNEIFLLDNEFVGTIKYITDEDFGKYFELDIKTNRKQKLEKILQRKK